MILKPAGTSAKNGQRNSSRRRKRAQPRRDLPGRAALKALVQVDGGSERWRSMTSAEHYILAIQIHHQLRQIILEDLMALSACHDRISKVAQTLPFKWPVASRRLYRRRPDSKALRLNLITRLMLFHSRRSTCRHHCRKIPQKRVGCPAPAPLNFFHTRRPSGYLTRLCRMPHYVVSCTLPDLSFRQSSRNPAPRTRLRRTECLSGGEL